MGHEMEPEFLERSMGLCNKGGQQKSTTLN